MRNLTTNTLSSPFDELFRDMNRFTVGLEPTMRLLDQVRSFSNAGYPPYDLESTGENTYRLSLAVAGFSSKDIEITIQDGVLTVEGKLEQEVPNKTYLHKGIAGRTFRRVLYLDQTVTVTESNLVDGILTIDFVKEIPEKMKPKKIAIGNKLPSAIEHKSTVDNQRSDV